MTSELPAQVGETIAGYELCGILGRGGMGCVFDAVHTKLGRRSALKFLAPELVGSDEYVKRFLSEARIVNSVRHPNIVDIYDFLELETPKRVAYVMEFVDGPSLGQLLKRQRLTVRQAINVTFQLADALEAVHTRGVVHRDLKPDNILVLGRLDSDLSQVPSVKILDFGIAKGAAAQVEHRTMTGAILGTPSYMAPEQVAGQDVSAATDIYALGEIFYEMVTGRRLFQGDRIQMMTQKLGGPSPDLTLPEDLTARDLIGHMVSHCLAVQPDMRPTMTDLAGCLTEILARQGPGPASSNLPPMAGPRATEPSLTPMAMASVAMPLPRPHTSNWPRMLIGAGLALVLGLGAAFALMKRRAMPDAPIVRPLEARPVGGTTPTLPRAPAKTPTPGRPQTAETPPAAPAAVEAQAGNTEPTTAPPPAIEAPPEPRRKTTRRRRRRRAATTAKPAPRSSSRQTPTKNDDGSIIKKGTIPTW